MRYSINIMFSLFILFLTIPQTLSAKEYKVAVRAHKGIEAAFKQWQPTIDYLSKQSKNNQFTLIPIVNLDEILKKTGDNHLDFVLTNPSSYIDIQQRYGATALVTLNNKRANTAQEKFGSVIFTHAKNINIININDLKNKTLIAVSKPAFGGWQVAKLEMINEGFNPNKELKELIFTQSRTQPEVVEAVLSRKADAGVVRTDLLERLEKKGKVDLRYLRILNNKDIKNFPFFLSTTLYPEWAFVATKKISSQEVKKVTQILMSITPSSAMAKAGKYIGWIAPDDYKTVVDLMKKLKIGSFSNE